VLAQGKIQQLVAVKSESIVKSQVENHVQDSNEDYPRGKTISCFIHINQGK
jgi:hypothetical protein